MNSCTLENKQETPEMMVQGQGQEGSMTLMQPNLYRTQFENGTPVMVTLNPYSSQLVDNLNKMMGDNVCYDTAMNPQLARLTATLRKKQRGDPQQAVNIHENSTMQLMERVGQTPGCMFQDRQRSVNPSDVVFRAVSPHGHVYWEINPTKQPGQAGQLVSTQPAGQQLVQHKSQHSSSDDNTNSDLQNISDFSDDDNRATSEMSRQSSSRFSESRPLIYSGSSTSTSPGHSITSDPRHLHQDHISFNTSAGLRQSKFSPRPPMTRSPWVSTGPGTHQPPNYQDEVYAYAATDFSSGGSGSGYVPEQVQSQVQIRDCRAVPVSVKSKEYIMAKIADYTERKANQV